MIRHSNAAPPKIRVDEVSFSRLQTCTRFPFRYGIASMTEVPHVVVQIRIIVNDHLPSVGIASEGLPPKWFTKSPDTLFEEHDLPEMLSVIAHAAEVLRDTSSATFFELWQQVHPAQTAWAAQRALPPLLANLGVALMERALLDALCRALKKPAWQLIHAHVLGILPGAVDSRLQGTEIRQFLPEAPLNRLIARHTVGLGDPLTDEDIPDAERIRDGLPHSLESCIREYGLCHFKVKICGDPTTDIPRLQTIGELLSRHAPETFVITLDGNEQFQNLTQFRDQWEQMQSDPTIRQMFTHLRFVEQPLHRDAALDASFSEILAQWKDAPPFIIDESDADLDSLPQALELGYSGTSHKNCKGITKSLLNAARLAFHRRETGRNTILSGEDLANIGPVALLQDLAMAAMLGIDSVERNGHHYFRGLSMFPHEAQCKTVDLHPDLYHLHSDGFATLSINDGHLHLDSVNRAPFGTAIDSDAELGAQTFNPVSET